MKKKFNKKLLLLGMLITALSGGFASRMNGSASRRTDASSESPEKTSAVSRLKRLNATWAQQKYIANEQDKIEWAPTYSKLKGGLAFASLLATGACYWSNKPVSATVSLGAITVGSLLWFIKSTSEAAITKREALATLLLELETNLCKECLDQHYFNFKRREYSDESETSDEKKITYIRIIELCNTIPYHSTLKKLQQSYLKHLQNIFNLDEGQRQKRFKLPKDELYKKTIQQIKNEQQEAIKSIKDKIQEKLQEKLQGEEEEVVESDRPYDGN